MTSLYRLEFSGHLSTILVSSTVMLLIALISSSIGTAAHDVVAASAEGVSGWSSALAAILITSLPPMLAAFGVYTLVDANEEVIRYEAGLYSSQGIGRGSIIAVWTVLYGLIPVLAYFSGILGYSDFNLRAALNPEVALPLTITTSTVLVAVWYKLVRILDLTPYAVLKSTR